MTNSTHPTTPSTRISSLLKLAMRVSAIFAVLVAVPAQAAEFVRGDVNADGQLDISDAQATLSYLFQRSPISCEDAADANDDGAIDISDASYLFNYLFRRGPAPTAPFDRPGLDPTTDDPFSCGDEACGLPTEGRVIYVDAEASDDPVNDGSEWSLAIADLQEALALAQPGDELWVAATGRYRPAEAGNWSERESFRLQEDVALYGGFEGDEACRQDRDLDNPTILDGALNDSEASPHSIHVVQARSVDERSILDGFHITGGRAGARYGGGLSLTGASPTIRNCLFSDNTAESGGAIYASGWSHVVVDNTVFQDNSARRGGATFGGRTTQIRSSQFIDNHAELGGAIYSHVGRELVVDDTVFEANSARVEGGAIHDGGTTMVQIRSSEFIDNQSRLGGAVYSVGRDMTISSSTFAANEASSGGAIFSKRNRVVLVNSLFHDNVAGNGGASYREMENWSSRNPIEIRNSTFAHNQAGGRGSHISGPSVVTNSVLWSEESSSGYAVAISNSCVASDLRAQRHSEVEWLTESPFVDEDADDFRLQATSPCVDAANSLPLSADVADDDRDGDRDEELPLDILGQPRVQGERVDLGAFEVQP